MSIKLIQSSDCQTINNKRNGIIILYKSNTFRIQNLILLYYLMFTIIERLEIEYFPNFSIFM